MDANGEKWVTVKQLAEALGYAHRDKLGQLIRRNRSEFEGKILTLKLSVSHPNSPGDLIINYHGMIRAAMLSDAPRAREFRDWAETVSALLCFLSQQKVLSNHLPVCYNTA